MKADAPSLYQQSRKDFLKIIYELFCDEFKRLIPINLQGKQSSIFVRSSASTSFSLIWSFDNVGPFAITTSLRCLTGQYSDEKVCRSKSEKAESYKEGCARNIVKATEEKASIGLPFRPH